MPREATGIVCVGGESVLREALAEHLKTEGFAYVLAAPDERRAWSGVLESRAAVVVDLAPSGPEGPFWRRLKSDPRTESVPVLRITPDLAEVGSLPPRFDAYLVPPVDPLVVGATVRALEQQRRMAGDGQLEPEAAGYDVERHLLERVAQAEASARNRDERIHHLEQEVQALERFLVLPQAEITARLYDSAPLREYQPELFQEFVAEWEQLFDLALEQRAFRVSYPVSDSLQAMSQRLGFLRAVPRDVVEIYRAALDAKSRGAADRKVQAYLEEGRLMVLELMGHLASYYRVFSSGMLKPRGDVRRGEAPEKGSHG